MWSEVGFKAMIHLYEDTVLYKSVVTEISTRMSRRAAIAGILTAGSRGNSSPVHRPTNSPDRGSTMRASIS